MKRAAIAAWIALASLGAAPGDGPAPRLDALRWNARERTAAGLADLEAGHAASAADELDAALGLRPEDPLVRFNAGTGRLAAGRPDAAAPLEQATRTAPDGLAPDAWYNLGAARLATGDAAGAAAAWTETLRRAPGRADAKRNLELALRALEQQRQQPQPPKDGSESDASPTPQSSAGDQDSSETEGQEPSASPRQDAGGSPPDADSTKRGEGGQPGSDDGGRPQQRERPPAPDGTPGAERADGPLPRFHDLPEMTAEQAAALLQAVENLERDERRRRARERALAAGQGDLDW